MVKAVDKTMVIGDIRLMMQERRTERDLHAEGVRSEDCGLKIEARIRQRSPNAVSCNPDILQILQCHERPRRRHQPGARVGDAAALRRPAPRATSRSTRFSTPGIATTLRRLLPEADVAFTPFVDRDIFPSATRLRWVQSPAVGVGSLMFPELLASPVVITSARGIRARVDRRARARRHDRARAPAAAGDPRAGRASLGAGRARGRSRRRSHAAGTAHGHRRPRRDRPRGREDRRAVRLSRLRDPPPRRRADARRRRGGLAARPPPRPARRRATSSSSPRRTRRRPSG